MVKEGPCYHCGIKTTPLWRNGPPAKPVLCNACGSRWRIHGTLKDYVPKHAMRHNTQSESREIPEDSDQRDVNSAADEANISEPSVPDFKNVPRRGRSTLDQYVLTPIGRFHRQLLDIASAEPEVFLNETPEDVLIDQANNPMFTGSETALGAMLLNSSSDGLKPNGFVTSSSTKTPDASASSK